MLNLFVLVTLQQFEEFTSKDVNPIEEFGDLITNFKIAWNKYSAPTDKGYKLKRNLARNFFMLFNWKRSSYKKNIQDVNKYVMELELL